MIGKTKVKCTAGEHKGKVGYIDGYVGQNAAVIVIGGNVSYTPIYANGGIEGYTLITEEEAPKEEWPKVGDDKYWTVTTTGLDWFYWTNDEKDNVRKNTFGIYRTEEKAQEAFDKMKEVARSLSGK